MFVFKFKKFTATNKKLIICDEKDGTYWTIEVADGSRITSFTYESFLRNKSVFKTLL